MRSSGGKQLVLRPAKRDDRCFRTELGGFYTTNAALVPEPEISDWVGVSTVMAGCVPELADGLRFILAGEQRFWQYADTQELDFDEASGRAGHPCHHEE